MIKAKTEAGKDRWASLAQFHEWWNYHCQDGWMNHYQAALDAWKESAKQTRKRLRVGKNEGTK